MTTYLLPLLIMMLSLCPSGLAQPACPYTWSRPAYNSSDNCTCGDDIHEIVQCNSSTREVKVLLSYCMTYDNTSNEALLGSCPYFPIADSDKGYVPLPKYAEDLNHAVCHHDHRVGRLCGECEPGYSPSPLTYDHDCTLCNKTLVGHWIAFLVYQFVPVTIFFFMVLVCRLQVISGPLTAYIFFAQVYSCPKNVRMIEILGRQASGISKRTFLNFEEALVTLYGVWNLDFARPYLGDLCLGKSITTVETVAMEYIMPFYLILLTVFIFIVVELHGHGFKPIVILWRPLAVCLSKFRKEWKITDSLIHTMATFLLLSYTKLVVVSVRILDGSFLYGVDGKKSLVPFYSAQNDYFRGEHAAFATLAILTLSTLVAIPPIVLLLYPLRKYHVCMGVFCRPRLQNGLRTFVESFQGCYKDGTSNRYDFRYTAGWYFLLRIIVAVGELDNIFSSHFGQQIIILILFLTAVGFALLQPYKKYLLNVVDTFHFFTLALIHWLLLDDVYLLLLNRGNKLLGVIAFVSILPCVYGTLVTIYWVHFIKKFPQRFYRWLKCQPVRVQRSASTHLHTKVEEANSQTPLCETASDNSAGSFADRLANPAAYDALIPSRRKTLARHHQTKALLVNEGTQTSWRLSSCRLTSETSVELPQQPQPPTSSVVEIEKLSWEETVTD